MSEDKRFKMIADYEDELGILESRSGDVLVLKHRDLNSEQFVSQLCQFLNDQNDTIEKLINDELYWEDKAIKRINELKEKIKELKNENMEYYKLINCSKCKYHNYDWGEDGDEFEVCDKGNNERLMYNQFCSDYKEM